MSATSQFILAGAQGANALEQSNAIKTQGQYQYQQLETNSQLADLQASSVISTAQQNTGQAGIRTGLTEGAERSSFAGQGVVVDKGSAAAVQASTAVQGALTEQQMMANAMRESWGLQVESLNYKSEADMAKLASDAKANQTLLTGGVSALNTLTSEKTLGSLFKVNPTGTSTPTGQVAAVNEADPVSAWWESESEGDGTNG